MQPGELIAGDRGARAQHDDLARAWAVLAEVMDPEVPVVSVVDLGIVRDLDWRAGHLHLVVTPTYSGCPATEVIEGYPPGAGTGRFHRASAERRLTPAWSTDWISEQGRERLRAYGIAPPQGSTSKAQPARRSPRCAAHSAAAPIPKCSASSAPLQGAVPLPRLPGAVRLFQMHLSRGEHHEQISQPDHQASAQRDPDAVSIAFDVPTPAGQFRFTQASTWSCAPAG
jgi:ring-1,2-phenylacetyl-CoA epoxidase subunit PaaD